MKNQLTPDRLKMLAVAVGNITGATACLCVDDLVASAAVLESLQEKQAALANALLDPLDPRRDATLEDVRRYLWGCLRILMEVLEEKEKR